MTWLTQDVIKALDACPGCTARELGWATRCPVHDLPMIPLGLVKFSLKPKEEDRG